MKAKSTMNTSRTIWVLIPVLVLVLLVGYMGVRNHEQATAPVHKRIPVYYWHMWTSEWGLTMNKVVDDFNASQTKYEVIPLQIPYGESDTKFLTSVAGGEPPDVMTQWDDAISGWSQEGILQPLDTRMTPQELEFFKNGTYSGIHNNGWYKGHLYGMVMGVDVYACYYRPDQFKAAGLDPNHFPTTLEELTEDAKKLSVKDSSGELTRVGFLPTGITNFAPSFGGGFWDPATSQVTLNTPANVRALSYIVGVDNYYGMNNVMRFNSSLKSQNGVSWPFIDGSFSITLDGEWRIKQLEQYAPNLKYEVAPLPPPAGGKAMASGTAMNYLTIPSGARHPDGAWAFIKFWSGLDHPANSAKYNADFYWLPSSPAMEQSPDYQAFLKQHPHYKTFVELAASKNLGVSPPVPYQLYLKDRILNASDLAERGTMTPEQALTSLEHEIAVEKSRRKELGYDQ